MRSAASPPAEQRKQDNKDTAQLDTRAARALRALTGIEWIELASSRPSLGIINMEWTFGEYGDYFLLDSRRRRRGRLKNVCWDMDRVWQIIDFMTTVLRPG